MNLIRRFVLPFAGVAAIAMLIAKASPRAVHAVTAALVQIVNTPTNAVPSIHAPAASQLYHGVCYGYWQVALVGGSYNATAHCSLPAIGSGQILFIEQVSASTGTAIGSVPDGVTLYDPTAGSSNFVFVPLLKQATIGAFDVYMGNAGGVRVGFPGPTQPTCTADVAGSGGTSMPPSEGIGGRLTCSISGYLTPAQ